MFKKIISLITIIIFSTIIGLTYTASPNLSLRLLEATDDANSLRVDLNYNANLVDDIFDTVSLTEFSYLNGVTSNIQDQLNAGGTAYTGDTEIVVTGSALSIGSAMTRDTELSSYYLKTAIDTQGEMETIWGVDLANAGDLHAAATVTTTNGLSISGQEISLQLATTDVHGALSDTDWDTFNGKEDETHAADHAVSAADTIFPVDPNADKYLMWDDNPGALVWSTVAGAAPAEDDIEAYIFDADAETITGNWDNTANPWADNEVSDTLTASTCTGTSDIATHVTITDNEDTAENNAVIFTEAGDLDGGNLGLESDGTFYYTPSTGVVTATGFAGTLTGNLTGNASGTAATVTGAAQANITSVGTLNSNSLCCG